MTDGLVERRNASLGTALDELAAHVGQAPGRRRRGAVRRADGPLGRQRGRHLPDRPGRARRLIGLSAAAYASMRARSASVTGRELPDARSRSTHTERPRETTRPSSARSSSRRVRLVPPTRSTAKVAR